MTDSELIAHLEELERKATPGEWEAQSAEENGFAYEVCDCAGEQIALFERSYDEQDGRDAAFIATLRNAAPRLLELAREALADALPQDTLAELDHAKEDRDAALARVAELEAERLHFLELIACTNRDGGHFYAEHGTEKSVQLGRDNYYAAMTRVAELEAALREIALHHDSCNSGCSHAHDVALAALAKGGAK